MIIETAVDHLLQQIPELAGRIYTDRRPQNVTRPAARYWRVSTEIEHDLDGPVGLDHARFQIEVFESSRLESLKLAQKIRRKLSRFRGEAGGLFVCGIRHEGGFRSFLRDPSNGSDQAIFGTEMDLIFSCAEPEQPEQP